MSFLFAPHGYDLRHDAGEIGIHQARKQRSTRTFGHKVDNSNAQLSQNSASPYLEIPSAIDSTTDNAA